MPRNLNEIVRSWIHDAQSFVHLNSRLLSFMARAFFWPRIKTLEWRKISISRAGSENWNWQMAKWTGGLFGDLRCRAGTKLFWTVCCILFLLAFYSPSFLEEGRYRGKFREKKGQDRRGWNNSVEYVYEKTKNWACCSKAYKLNTS